MRAADTNVLVRLILGEETAETAAVTTTLSAGEPIYVSNIVMCELVWVLKSRYRQPRAAIAEAMGRLIDSDQVVMDRDAALAGLGMLKAGAGFSDGVILYEARRAGARDLMTFDRDLAKFGGPMATLLS
ncbi:type II toxin-antitoxin system VapC family toxin [Brevundimonas sp.]|uniref:type II toxin-antitoxin system VapC family toxin n=1 Tax=Brevundimonas sp. TaxID=1871086 RepID=UPI002E1500A0|nr:type II toxin-antitoxin system VapC family toxin [Brevundimonas sp.]